MDGRLCVVELGSEIMRTLFISYRYNAILSVWFSVLSVVKTELKRNVRHAGCSGCLRGSHFVPFIYGEPVEQSAYCIRYADSGGELHCAVGLLFKFLKNILYNCCFSTLLLSL